MIKAVISICLLASAFVASVSSTCFVCPQAIPNDPNNRFCASNANGVNFNVTQSQLSNWNCNHPFNKLTTNSQAPCPPNAPVNCSNECDQFGTPVCGKLGLQVTEFANICQFNLYNCQNPGSSYKICSLL